MDLAQFRATGRDVPDLGVEIPGMDLEGKPGRVYCHEGGAYIERHGDGWYLLIERSEYEGPLEQLEERLFDWCRSAGFFDPAPRVTAALYETEEGSDDPRAIQGGGGASERLHKIIRGTRRRIDAYRRAYLNRYGDELVVRFRP